MSSSHFCRMVLTSFLLCVCLGLTVSGHVYAYRPVSSVSPLDTLGTTFPTSTPTAGSVSSSGPYLVVDGALIAFIGVIVVLILIRNFRQSGPAG